jgi:hypothetical protein
VVLGVFPSRLFVLVGVLVFLAVSVFLTLLGGLRRRLFGVPRRVPVASAAQEPNACQHHGPTRRFPR